MKGNEAIGSIKYNTLKGLAHHLILVKFKLRQMHELSFILFFIFETLMSNDIPANTIH